MTRWHRTFARHRLQLSRQNEEITLSPSAVDRPNRKGQLCSLFAFW